MLNISVPKNCTLLVGFSKPGRLLFGLSKSFTITQGSLLLNSDTTENVRRLLPLHESLRRQLFLCFCSQQVKKLKLSAIQPEFLRLRYALSFWTTCLESVAHCGEAASSWVRMRNWTLLSPLTNLLFKDKKPLIGRSRMTRCVLHFRNSGIDNKF